MKAFYSDWRPGRGEDTLREIIASIDKVEKEAFELDRISITEIFPKARKGKRNHYDSTIPVPERMR